MSKPAEFKKLNIARNEIQPYAEKFCDINFEEFSVKSIEKKGETRQRLPIEADGKDFYIDFHYNSDGTTTIDISGGKEPEIKYKIATYIKDNCIKDDSENKYFIINNIDEDDFNAILDIIEESDYFNKLLKRDKDVKNDIIFQCKGKFNEKLTINYYHNKKVLVQGKPFDLFAETTTMFSELIETSEIPKVFNDCYKLDINKDHIIAQFECKLPNSYDMQPTKLKKVLLQAVYNTNIKGDMFEYSFLVHPALRAIEGHLKYILKEYSIMLDKKNAFGCIFKKDNVNNKFYMNDVNKDIIGNGDIIKHVETLYNYYYKNRHSLSHWNDVEILDTTRFIESHSEAIRIIDDTLKLIDSYYIIVKEPSCMLE